MVDTKKEEVVVEKKIECYVPKKLNINFLGEWIVKIETLCYGISVRAADKKVMITYNINPQDLHKDHFEQIEYTDVPKKIWDMFQKKLSADIMRLDSMMNNLVINKGHINRLFNFAEEQRELSTTEFDHEITEYSEVDALADKKKEHMLAQQYQRNQKPWRAATRAKAKQSKEARKKQRKKK